MESSPAASVQSEPGDVAHVADVAHEVPEVPDAHESQVAPVALAVAPPRRGLQAAWLSVYWSAFGLSALLALLALLYAALGAVSVTNATSVVLSAAALLIGCVLATKLVRRRVTNTGFVRGTITTRTIAIGWLLVWVAMIGGLFVEGGVEFVTEATKGILGAIGAVAILAMVGLGYGEYRETLGDVD